MGFSLGEIVLLLLVGIIVVGPKNLPAMMRTAGQWVNRLRRMSMDLRSQSGIDDLLRREGLDQHIHELRSLARMNVVDSLIATSAAPARPLDTLHARPASQPRQAPPSAAKPQAPLRTREYPVAGCDSYGALPDDVAPYTPPAGAPVADARAVEPAAPAAEPPGVEAAGQGPS